MSFVVVPFAVVFDVTVIDPVHVPGVKPAVLILTVSVAGVLVLEDVTCSQVCVQFNVGAVVVVNEIGKAIPVLVMAVCCEGGVA